MELDFRRSLPELRRDPKTGPRPASLPPGYGREKLVALPRDSRWVYVYWEMAPAKLTRILAEAAAAQPELHLALAETRKPVKELRCSLEAGCAWIEALPGETFFVELGLAGFGRPFTVLLRSEAFRLPWGDELRERTRPSLELPEELRRFKPPSPGSGPPRED
ncbi:MAG: DUF4912 domain-containing protein [Elusimicrobia bacterium]|nr:DUF4912 domain-containing protein [Elusimicrobiota bacterium]